MLAQTTFGIAFWGSLAFYGLRSSFGSTTKSGATPPWWAAITASRAVAAFIGSALLFTAAVLLYSIEGGLRSSIFTDVLHTATFVVFLGLVLFLILPKHAPSELLNQGTFTLATGADLLLVALLQVLSYAFHDPVLTDRGFITEEKVMLRSYVVAGIAGFAAIFLFSLVGIHARIEALTGGDTVPAAVARSFGLGALFLMTIIMVNAAGSTSTPPFLPSPRRSRWSSRSWAEGARACAPCAWVHSP